MSSSEVVDLVAEFLQAHGYGRASAVLKSEIEQNARGAMSGMETKLEKIIRQAQPGGESSEAPIVSLANGRGTTLAESYGLLEDWVAGSLEAHKHELRSVTFPIFAHCYLKLVQSGSAGGDGRTVAASFFDRWGTEHGVWYAPEVRQLGAVTAAEQIAASDLAQSIVGPARTKFKVPIDRVSSELLHSFLSSNALVELLVICNDHVQLLVEDRPPRQEMAVATLLPNGAAPGTSAGGLETEPMASGAYSRALEEAGAPGGSTLPRHTFLGDPGGYPGTRPYPKLFDGGAPSVPERLLTTAVLHPTEAYPPEAGRNASLRAPTGQVASARTPSVLLATVVNSYKGLACAAVTRDACQVAAGFQDGVVRVWRLDSGAEKLDDSCAELKGHTGGVFALSYSPEHRRLASGGRDGGVHLWDLSTGLCLAVFKGHDAPVWALSFSPAGHYLVAGAADQTARLWATDTSEALRLLVGHYSDVTAVAWHPNCAYVVTGSNDKTARVWEVGSGRCVRVFVGHLAAVTCLAVCPSGKYLATGSQDRDARVWDLDTGKQVAHCKGHQGAIHDLDYSAEGDVLASCGADSTVRTWDLAGAFAVATSRGEDHCAAMAPNSSFHTKSTPVVNVRWTMKNLLLAVGAFEVK